MIRQGAYNTTGAKQLCAIYKGKAKASKAEQVQTTKEFLKLAQEITQLDNELTDSDAEEYVRKRLPLIKVHVAGRTV
jgi:hypothetical protein